MDRVIAIDIGGTKTSVSVIDIVGWKVLKNDIFDTGRLPKPFLNFLISVLKRDYLIFSPKGIGIAAPSPLISDGVLENPPNLPQWRKFNVKKFFENMLRLNVMVENDANAAALAEYYRGGCVSGGPLIYVTASTGIGAGVISAGKIFRGNSNFAGEIGHMKLEPDSTIGCGCGMKGCLEALASGSGISFAADMVAAGRVGALKSEAAYKYYTRFVDNNLKLRKRKSFSGMSAKEIAYLQKNDNDPLARYLIWRGGFYLGLGISNVCYILNPSFVVLGGSLAVSSGLYYNSFKEAVKIFTWQKLLKVCKIKKSKLKNNVDLGAAALFLAK